MPPGLPASPLASAPVLAVSACPPSPSPPTRLAAASGNRCGHVPGAPRFDRVNLPEDANHARPALIGKAIAKRCHYGFDMEVVFYNRSRVEDAGLPARQVDMAEAMAADFVVVAVPGGKATYHLIDATALGQMKPG